MEPDNFSKTPDTDEVGTTPSIDTEGQKDLSVEIPGLYELPPETQEVVKEAYGHYEGLRQTIENHTKGTEVYIEKIPEALTIVEKNISSSKQIPTEVPPEKQGFVDDTVNIVTLCKKVDELGIDNLDTKKQLAVYSKLEEYAKKHNVEGLKVKLEAIKNIEEIREYYANTPKAIIQRIQDNIRSRHAFDENIESDAKQEKRKESYYRKSKNNFSDYNFKDIITSTTQDYSHGDKREINRDYGFAFRNLNDMCKGTSIASNEDFMELLDEKTKAIGDIQKKISDGEVCFKQIAERTGIDIDTPSHPKTEVGNPLEKAKGIFGTVAIKDRLRKSITELKTEIINRGKKAGGIKRSELNHILDNLVNTTEEYLQNCDEIDNLLPFPPPLTTLELRWEINNFEHQKIDIEEERKREKEEEPALIEALQSTKLLFHGTTNPNGRLAIATGNLMSKKRQGTTYGEDKVVNNTMENDIVSISFGEGLNNSNEAKSYGGWYTDSFFYVAIPEGIAFRNYGARKAKKEEIRLYDRKKPKDGAIINPQDAFLIMDKHAWEILEKSYGEEFEDKVRDVWGNNIIICAQETIPEEIKVEGLKPVSKARKLPSSFVGTSEIYNVYYSEAQ